jgi:hypothetical protein
VRIQRTDGSTEEATLNTREFMRHDMAHMAVEMEVPIARGYWGSVAAGLPLDGMSITGPDIVIAESLAGPAQSLIRDEADKEMFYSVLARMQPELITQELAYRIHERGRKLLGHWRATPFGGDMVIEWEDLD